MSKFLILGDGLLGTELQKQTGWNWISRKKDIFDFIVPDSYVRLLDGYDTIINCIGYTNTYDNCNEHININLLGVIYLSNVCKKLDKKIVHISTDYLYANNKKPAKETVVLNPIANKYGVNKLMADEHIKKYNHNHLIIRTSFKPTPFPYPKAVTTQIGNFDYVDVIAGLIIKLIEKEAVGIFNVGTEPKTMYELALQTRPDVEPWYEKINELMPTDIRMDLTKIKEFLKNA